MKRVVEYESWTKPGRVVSQDFGKEIQEAIWQSGIPKDFFLGVSNIPDPADVELLGDLISSGTTDIQRFHEFCLRHGFPANITNECSAAMFIAYIKGACVAWIHLPEDSDIPAMLENLQRALKPYDLVIVEA